MGKKSNTVNPVVQAELLIKEKLCKVISYNMKTKNLDVDFDGYGIRIKNVENFVDKTVTVKYQGTIGKPDFKYFL